VSTHKAPGTGHTAQEFVVVATRCSHEPVVHATRGGGINERLHSRTKHAGRVRQTSCNFWARGHDGDSARGKTRQIGQILFAPSSALGRDVRILCLRPCPPTPDPLISFPSPACLLLCPEPTPRVQLRRSIGFQITPMAPAFAQSPLAPFQHHAASCGCAPTQPRARCVSRRLPALASNGSPRPAHLRRRPARPDASLQLR
jgi:hypothetical protein